MAATMVDQWRFQSSANKQGSSGNLDEQTGATLTRQEARLHSISRAVYKRRLDVGVAREQARKDLPLSTYTEAYWKIDLHNLLHFLDLRLHNAAQHEIRSYANVISSEIVARWCPLVWESFLEYRIGSLGLSKTECVILRLLNMGTEKEILDELLKAGFADVREGRLVPNREGREFADKLAILGVSFRWPSG